MIHLTHNRWKVERGKWNVSFVLCILMFALMCTKVNCLVLESDIKKTRYGDPCLKNLVMAIFPFCRDKACLVRQKQTFGNQ